MSHEERLSVHVKGEGDPALLFVHGFGCSLDDWAAQIEGLSSSFECIALDLPGHGASAMPQETSIAALASAVNRAKAQRRANKVVLIGHSLGSKVVREAYCQSNSDVAGIVLIEGTLYEGDAPTLLQRAADAVDSVGFRAYAEQHFDAMFVEGSDPAMRQRALERIQAFDPDYGRDLYLEAVRWDPARSKDTLRQIAVPVLMVQSTHLDSHFTRVPLPQGTTTPFMDTVASLCADVEMQVVSGCGHFPMIEAADVVNRHLREFATRVTS